MIHLFNGAELELSADGKEIVSIAGVAFEPRMMVAEQSFPYMIIRQTARTSREYMPPRYLLVKLSRNEAGAIFIEEVLRDQEVNRYTYRDTLFSMGVEIMRLSGGYSK